MARDAFYQAQVDSFKRGEKPTQAIGIFDVLLFTENKEIILQKRSPKKSHNPYLIDKTVGGHIQYGDSVFYTAMIESVQELKIPSVTLRDGEDFMRTLTTLRNYLENVAVLELIDNKSTDQHASGKN